VDWWLDDSFDSIYMADGYRWDDFNGSRFTLCFDSTETFSIKIMTDKDCRFSKKQNVAIPATFKLAAIQWCKEKFSQNTQPVQMRKPSVYRYLLVSENMLLGKSIYGQLRDCYRFHHGWFCLSGQLWNVNKTKAVASQHLPSIQKQNDISTSLLSLLNAPHKVNLPPRAGKQSCRRVFHLSDLNDRNAAELPISQRNGSIHWD